MITQARLKELLDYDPVTGVFVWKVSRGVKARQGVVAGGKHSRGYARIRLDYSDYFAHRLAWLYMTGEWPREQVDHINCVRTDNRFENLREATNAENNRNGFRRANNTSGYKGVHWVKRSAKWAAQIATDEGRKFLGHFDRIEDAAAAYVEASARLHKEFGRAA